MPHLAVREPSGERLVDPRVKQVADRDPDDVGTAEFVVSLAPAVCLTRDRDLIDSGLGTAEWLGLVFAIEDVGEFRALLEGTVLFIHLAGRGIIRLFRASPWLVVALLGLLGTLVMRLPGPEDAFLRVRQRFTILGQFYLEFVSRGAVAEAHVKSQLILPSADHRDE